MSAIEKRKCPCGGNQHRWYRVTNFVRQYFWRCFHCGREE